MHGFILFLAMCFQIPQLVPNFRDVQWSDTSVKWCRNGQASCSLKKKKKDILCKQCDASWKVRFVFSADDLVLMSLLKCGFQSPLNLKNYCKIQ